VNYFVMCHEAVDGRYTDGDVLFTPPLEDYYQVGRFLQTKDLIVDLTMDKKVRSLKSDFFLTGCGSFFVSDQLKAVFGKFEVDLEFVPAVVKYHSGKPVEKRYYLIHANSKVPCFDYRDSEYAGKSLVLSKIQSGELSPDYNVRGITRLCINEVKARSLDFFFIQGAIWIDPIVSENLVREVQDKKLCVRFLKAG